MSMNRASAAYLQSETITISDCARMFSACGRHGVVRWIALVLAAASLAACVQTPVASRRSDFAPTRHAAVDHSRPIWFVTRERKTAREALAPQPKASETRVASRGVASFYSEGTRTANGEKFDPNELTAAHPSLPFGTRLRVTNMSTGRSVTVRVNDRGPFKKGRVVDVSYSAAKQLGMVHAGVANVKMDVVQ